MNDTTQPLVELIYFSHSINTLTQQDFQYLLQGAQEKNARMDITGAIIYGQGVFLQLIEGPRDNINRLFQSISHDARHYDVSLISFKTVENRHFAHWSMNYLEKDSNSLLNQSKPVELFDVETCRKLFGI